MKVHLIKIQTIHDFVAANAQSRVGLDNWLKAIKVADWKEPKDILATFGNADNLGNGVNRIVFNIGGNNYRLVCEYVFGNKRVHLFICWIGTHAAYTEMCKRKEQYTINKY